MPVDTRVRLQALVADFGGQASVASALRVDRSRVNRWLRDATPDATNLRKLEGTEFALARLSSVYDRPTAVKWLMGVNAHLGDRRPIDLLVAGRVAEVIAAIDAEESGAYA